MSLEAKSPPPPKPALLTRISTVRPEPSIVADQPLALGRIGEVAGDHPGLAAEVVGDLVGEAREAAPPRRATRVTCWPRRASSRAISAPIPEEAPVTSAVAEVEGPGSPI